MSVNAQMVHSCYHTAAYSAESSTTEIWFFPELNTVVAVTRYDGWSEPGPVHYCFHGGTDEAHDTIRKHLRIES